MASLQQHMQDCREFLGDECVEVNRWIDEFFAALGPTHRKMRHHWEGIREAESLFGDQAAKAAAIHILRDCRHIPTRADYGNGAVDILGLKKEWPVSAYVRYTEEDFRAVVNNQLFGASGLFLWAFVNQTTVKPLLASSTKLSEKDIEALQTQWVASVHARATLSPLPPVETIETDVPSESAPYIDSFLSSAAAGTLTGNFGELTFAKVPVEALVTPLVFLDGEYLESLKPELQSSREIDVIRFALPSVTAMQVRTVADLSMRNVTFLSSVKTLTVGPCSVTQTPDGTEVRFLVGANASFILVGLFNNRLIVRNGIHRAFMLAKLGLKTIPCILIREVAVPTLSSSAYPSFVPPVLMLPRPPLVLDYNNPNLTLEAPLQRTQKMIRISAEETILPVD